MTAPSSRDRSLRERFATEQYRAWVTAKKAWLVRTKFLRGCAVPLDLPVDGEGKRHWEGVRRCADALASGVAFRGGVKALVRPVDVETLPRAGRSLPRPIRRIYERMLERVPSLDGKTAERWIPPPASEEELRWIRGG